MHDIAQTSRNLLVLRHGKSDWDADYGGDFDRPLANRGIKAAIKMGKHIAQLELVPELIISSPARRAITTAQLVADQLDASGIEQDPTIYGAGVRQLVQIVSSIPDGVHRAMIVGHNPGLESLVEELTGESFVVMKTCSLALLEGKGDSWNSPDSPAFVLRELYHPRELP